MRRRVEATPKQQLAELRRAYEYYAALSNQLSEGVDTAVDADHQRVLAQNASRIAEAYKKSIAKSCAQMERVAALEVISFPIMRTIGGLIAIAMVTAIGVLIFTNRSQLINLVLPVISDPLMTSKNAVAARELAPSTQSATASVKPKLLGRQMSDALIPLEVPSEEKLPAESRSDKSNKKIWPPHKREQNSRSRASKVNQAKANVVPASPMSAEFVSQLNEGVGHAGDAVADSPPTTPTDAQLSAARPQGDIRPLGQGTTQIEISMSEAGQITGCQVTKSSGSTRRDGTACNLVQNNWDAPAFARGRPASGKVIVSVIWNITSER